MNDEPYLILHPRDFGILFKHGYDENRWFGIEMRTIDSEDVKWMPEKWPWIKGMGFLYRDKNVSFLSDEEIEKYKELITEECKKAKKMKEA